MPRRPRNGLFSGSMARNGSGLSAPASSVRTISGRPPSRSAISVSAATCSSSARRRGAVVEEELRAQQPDALGALFDRERRIAGVADVGEDLDAPAVREHDGLVRRRERLGAGDGIGLAALLERRGGRGVGFDRDGARVAVERQRGALRDRQQRGSEADDERDPERPGDDRGMVERPAAGRRDPPGGGGVELRDRPRRQFVGDDDAGLDRGLGLCADEFGEHAVRDVVDVDRPRAEVRIVGGGEDGGDLVGRLLERARRRLAVRDRGLGGVDQRGVREQQRLRREDLGLARGQPRRGRGELLARGVERGGEPPRLLLAATRR